MILIDTSIWIDLLGKSDKSKISHNIVIDHLFEVVTCLPVIQEVLQGVRDDNAHRRIRRDFDRFNYL